VLLPSLSSYISRGDYDKFHETYSFTLKLMLFILIPALAGLIALRIPICNILYQRGEFTYEATLATAQTLAGYCLGLWAVGGLRVTAPAFYAMQDTKTPVVVAFFALLLNAALGFVLGFTLRLEHTGLALANSASSVFNFLTLIYLLERRTGDLKARDILLFCLKMVVVSGVMAGAAWTISTYADWTGSDFSVKKITVLALSIGASGIIFVILTKILKIEEAGFLLNLIRRKIPGGKKPG
jgi:putative peptidoglycan lipid II flippase